MTPPPMAKATMRVAPRDLSDGVGTESAVRGEGGRGEGDETSREAAGLARIGLGDSSACRVDRGLCRRGRAVIRH